MTQQTKVPVVAVVLAAGSGVRFDPAKPKQLVALNGKPIVAWSIEAFENDEHVDDIVVVVNNTVREAVEQLIDDASYDLRSRLSGCGRPGSGRSGYCTTEKLESGPLGGALFHYPLRHGFRLQRSELCLPWLSSH